MGDFQVFYRATNLLFYRLSQQKVSVRNESSVSGVQSSNFEATRPTSMRPRPDTTRSRPNNLASRPHGLEALTSLPTDPPTLRRRAKNLPLTFKMEHLFQASCGVDAPLETTDKYTDRQPHAGCQRL